MRDGVEALRPRASRSRRLARRLPALRDRLRRRDRQQPPRRAVEGPRPAALPRSGSRARRAGPRGMPTSCTRTGCPRRSRRSRRASRSCSSSGARTSRSLAVRAARATPRRSCAVSSSSRRRRSPRTRGALGAHDVRVDPDGVRDPGGGRRAGRARRTCSTSAGCRRRRACATSPRRPSACRSWSSATGRCGTLFPQAVGFVPPAELGPFYERAAVVVVPSRREGYGVVAREAMAHGDRSSRPRSAGWSTRSRTASPGSSSPLGTSRRSGTPCPGFSRTQRSAGGSGRPRASERASDSPPKRVAMRWRTFTSTLRAASRVAGVAASGRSVPPFRSRDADRRLVSYAQIGEDVRLARVLWDRPPGFYVDVGAGDSVSNSVTRLFYEPGGTGSTSSPGRRSPGSSSRARAT